MSAAQAKARLVTPEELYGPEFAHLKRAELWEGELIEMSPSNWLHSIVSSRLGGMMERHLCAREDLFVSIEGAGFTLSIDPAILVSPDVAVFTLSAETTDTWVAGSPIVAVEVLSPSNSASEIGQKRAWYLDYGTEQVWIVDPRRRVIDVYTAGGRIASSSGPQLCAEGLLSELVVSWPELFRGLDGRRER